MRRHQGLDILTGVAQVLQIWCHPLQMALGVGIEQSTSA